MLKCKPFRCLALLLLAASVLSCTTSPTGRSQLLLMPGGQLDQMGAAAFADMKKSGKLSRDQALNQYVSCVANAITTALPANQQQGWEVVVFADDSANAFALPGGKMGVNTGLLSVAADQNQLATVLGHEVAHVLAQHGNERMSLEFAAQTATQVAAAAAANSEQRPLLMAALGLGVHYGMKLPYSRTHEAEADVMGLELMSRAGFNPRSSVQLWRNMAAQSGNNTPEFMSTHPAHSTRIEGLSARVPEMLPLYDSARAQGKRPNCQR